VELTALETFHIPGLTLVKLTKNPNVPVGNGAPAI